MDVRIKHKEYEMKSTKRLMVSTLALIATMSTACSKNAMIGDAQLESESTGKQSEYVKPLDQGFKAKLLNSGVDPALAQLITQQGLSATGLTDLSVLTGGSLSGIAPLFLQGALGSFNLGALSGLSSSDKLSLIQTIMSSFTGSLGGHVGSLPIGDLSSLFGNLGGTQVHILPVLEKGNLPLDQILRSLGGGFTVGLGQTSLSPDLLSVIMTQFPSGLLGGLSGNQNILSLVNGFNGGAITGMPLLGQNGVDIAQLSQWLSAGTSGGLVGKIPLGNLSSILSQGQLGLISAGLGAGFNITDLSSLLQGGSLGSLVGLAGGGLSGIQIADLARMFSGQTLAGLPGLGLNLSQISDLTKAFSAGGVGAGDKLGLNAGDISNLIHQINFGGVAGLGSTGLGSGDLSSLLQMLSMGSVAGLGNLTSLSPELRTSLSRFGIMGGIQGLSQLGNLGGAQSPVFMSLVQSLSSGSMAGLGGAGLPTSFLQTGASNIAFGSFMGMFFGGFGMEDILHIMPVVNQGAQQGLVNGGFQGSLLNLLLNAVKNVTDKPDEYTDPYAGTPTT